MRIKSVGRNGSLWAGRSDLPVLLVTGLALLVMVPAMFLAGSTSTSAQQTTSCEVVDLGTLGAEADATLEAEGRWSTEDCDSSFHLNSDAHDYTFAVEEAGRVRIDLKSADADSFLYLLDADGNRITDNDDGGGSLDARIERDLEPGVYSIEATTVGGRRQGAADFELTISRVQGCEPTHLGLLELGTDLETTGTWTLDTCGSRFVVEHPAFGYTFELATGGRVRLDLRSTEGDAVMSLISPTRGLISANDDGGERRNSRIERYLEAGTYLVEATTYWERDAQLASADFELVIHLVDEQERQESGFQLKIEAGVIPDEAIVGVPFDVHYRIGNVGNGPMTEEDGTIDVYAIAPRNYDTVELTIDPDEGWGAGVSYHTNEASSSATSTESVQVQSFEITMRSTGTSWVWLVVVVNDSTGEEIGFHSQWRELKVLSGMEFDETVVSVDEAEYTVSSKTDDEGEVTVLVVDSDDAEAEVDATVRAKAIYTAGVGTEFLDGIFERPALADLPEVEEVAAISVFDPSSQTLSIKSAELFADAIIESELDDSLASGTAIDPADVEDLVVSNAERAASQYASIASTLERIHGNWESGQALWFSEALSVHSLLAYTESVIAPTVKAGEIVTAAREADDGWNDEEVRAMMDDLRSDASCRGSALTLRESLRIGGVTNADELINVDAELRSALPLYAHAVDAVMCTIGSVVDDNDAFVSLLSPADHEVISSLIASTTEPAPQPTRLRIVVQLWDDGRTEHGVEIVGGGQVLPDVRFLSADAATGIWHSSSDVMVDENSIGKIRTRRLPDGRIELGFVNTGGEVILPDIRYVPAGISEGVWIRSGEIEIPLENSLE